VATHYVLIVLTRNADGPKRQVTMLRFATQAGADAAAKFVKEQADAVTHIIRDY
jgi:hypothetical protein